MQHYANIPVNSLNAELNSIYHLLALLGAHHNLHVSGVRVKHTSLYRTKFKSFTNYYYYYYYYYFED